MDMENNLTNKWIAYLEDTRNEIAMEFMFPIREILDNETIDAECKVREIEKINELFRKLQSKWDIKDYGIFLNHDSQ